MREGTFLGEKIVMSDAKWEACLRRVDVKRAKKRGYKYFIRIRCPLCHARSREAQCPKCPLDVFRLDMRGRYGCVNLLFLLAKRECNAEHSGIELLDDCVKWLIKTDKVARHVLQVLHAGLLKMKEV